MGLLSFVRNALSGTPKTVTAQPDWLASTQSHAAGPGTVKGRGLPFASPTARSLSPSDLKAAAKALGVDVAAVMAIREVEAAGDGFLSDNRPKILFEAHHFSKFTKGRFDKSHPNISSRKWNKALYGKGGNNQYVRLAQAMVLDREAALKSASWGLGQIMGSNFVAAGFSSVDAFVESNQKDEWDQLLAVVNFIKANPLMHKAIKAKDWAGFAKRYNGPGQVPYYAARLEAAYKRAAAVS